MPASFKIIVRQEVAGEAMPNSRRRKKQVAASRRQLEKTRRRLQMKEEERLKENRAWEAEGAEGDNHAPSKGWLEWCATGVTQVRCRQCTMCLDC